MNIDWKNITDRFFGSEKPSDIQTVPVIPVTSPYELTEREREFLRIDRRTWVDPMKFMIYKNAVIRYVTTHRSGFDYPCCYGIYDDPHPVLQSILNSDEYKGYLEGNAKMPSVQPLVNMAIHAGMYTFPQSDYVTSQCEMAIAYYHKTGGTNRES